MSDRLKKLEERYEQQNHMDLFLQAKHTLEALDGFVKKHRQYTSMQALSGVKIEGGEEVLFYSTMVKVKDIIVDVLEKTIEDLENRWDKNYNNNFNNQ